MHYLKFIIAFIGYASGRSILTEINSPYKRGDDVADYKRGDNLADYKRGDDLADYKRGDDLADSK
ncbi:uncharacterized protein EAF02_002620 [Botrytis sinoallii]|uniref:uncharacterized protein n=1 Tax=Botrytis sinoallii TaxID=1463999 RepID=UPI00190229B7|nr:uncharacterized protein EAF02_002620 [Botrytis sinoallii]KAF7888079.1 hypothetical protein EAF02_002620 [Botrytis sinoallii]